MNVKQDAGSLTEPQKNLLKLAAKNHHVVTLDSGVYNGSGITKSLIPYPTNIRNAAAFQISKFGLQLAAYLERHRAD